MSLFQVGHINSLRVLRTVSIGAYLDGGDGTDILLPLKYLPAGGVSEGDVLDVFIYHDNEGRLIATTLRPYISVGEVAWLECVGTSAAGAFLDMGIHKDLLVPFSEQNRRMEVGHRYMVYLYLDQVSRRLVGSAKLNKHIGNLIPDCRPGDEVSVTVAENTPIGWKCIVNNKFWGMIYHDETDVSLSVGSKHRAYVVRSREDDKLDLSLQRVGYHRIDSSAVALHRLLHQNGGILKVGDKSDPEEIRRICGMSKKVFKQAAGSLYKDRIIKISDDKIELIIK